MRRCHSDIISFCSPSLLSSWSWRTLLAANCVPIVSAVDPVASAEMPDWSRAWLGSQKCRGAPVSVTARSHLWLQPPAVQTKATGENMKPALSVSTKPLKYRWHVFSSKAKGREKKGENLGIRKAVGRVTALCGGCLFSVPSAWRWISFQRQLGECHQ